MAQKNVYHTDIAILGGGAAGLIAAVSAARCSGGKIKIAVVEKNARVGKQLLTTGSGRCNLSNLLISRGQYSGSLADGAARLFQTFDCGYIRDYFKTLGLYTRADGEGRIYPVSSSASSVLDVLRLALREYGVQELCSTDIDKITQEKNLFYLHSADSTISCRALIMTTGGKAAAKDGGRAGYGLLKQLNHTCTKLFPTLCPVPVKSGALRSLKGQRCMCSVTLKNGGHSLAREQGELQFTENALSGICVFQLSRQCAQLLDQGEAPILCADLLPDISYQELFGELSRRIKEGKLQAEELLTGILNKRIALSALKESGAAPLNRCAAEIKERELKGLCQILKGWEFEAASPGSFQQAQATAGGVPRGEVDIDTMASRKKDGLFFAGELLDLDGICGGYNLHWAWTSGIIAGKHAFGYLQKDDNK